MGAEPPRRLLVSTRQDGSRNELLEVAVDAARMAGALLLERARAGAEQDVESKSTPTDLVSEADLASERAIRELLLPSGDPTTASWERRAARPRAQAA